MERIMTAATYDTPPPLTSQQPEPIHPLAVRVTHWVNAAAMVIMILSGWQIHNAYPTLPFRFPEEITLGGWLGGATQWHFAAMWVLMANGVVYLAYGLVSGRLRRKFLPIRLREVVADMAAALSGTLKHDSLATYNSVQRLLYLGVTSAGILAVLTGLAIWKPVQFRELTSLFGDYDAARIIHFTMMAVIVLFLAVHVAMALLVPKSLRAMIRGR
jgi:thiosulfate reductase cytochrome b subunit